MRRISLILVLLAACSFAVAKPVADAGTPRYYRARQVE